MRFFDEKILWVAETEAIARKMENKSYEDLMEIINSHDIIQLRSCSRPKTTVLGRLLFPFVALVFLILMPFKWVITGNTYFDSICKKYKWLQKITEFVGLR